MFEVEKLPDMTREVLQLSACPPTAKGCQKPGGNPTVGILGQLHKDFGDRATEVCSATRLFIAAFAKQLSSRLYSSRRELEPRSSSVQAGLCPVCAVRISPVATGVDVLTAEVDFKMSSWICGRPAALIEDHAQEEFRVSTEKFALIAFATRHFDLKRLICQTQWPTSSRRRSRVLVKTIKQYDPLLADEGLPGLRCRQDGSIPFIEVDFSDNGQGYQLSRRPILLENFVATKCLQSDHFPILSRSINHILNFTNQLESFIGRPKKFDLVGNQKMPKLLRHVLFIVLGSSRCIVKNVILVCKSLNHLRLTVTALLGGVS